MSTAHRLALLSVVAVTAFACSTTPSNGPAPAGSGTVDDAGSGAPQGDAGSSPDAAPDAGPSGRWQPRPGTTWQWQLSGTGPIDTGIDAQVFDIDLYDTTPATIAALKAKGRKVICYFDTAYEPGRPDSAALEPYRHNAVKGWPGQFWLDVRVPAVVAVMKARIALAQAKGCDGIEADDVDSYSNDPGTGITAADQQAFIRTLAHESHDRGMAYGLKSDLADIPAVIADVDFDINEECFKFSECDALLPFVQTGKAVFEAEYTDGDLAALAPSVCPSSNQLKLDTIIKHLDLGSARYPCR